MTTKKFVCNNFLVNDVTSQLQLNLHVNMQLGLASLQIQVL
jgi:hypothetical protein